MATERLGAPELKRLGQILLTAVRHGFGFVVAEIGLERYLPRAYRRVEKIVGSPRDLPRQFREMLEELGPTFVKIGQVLSVRPDILPLEYIEELERLQDAVPPFSGEEARRIVASELGASVESLFASFEDEPVASASLSQVHRAIRHDGKVVAVKIQRPSAAPLIEKDLRIMRYAAELVRDRVTVVDTLGLWEEFAYSLRKELDFVYEAGNIERFATAFADEPLVMIPRVHWDLTTKRVLTMDFVDGWKLSEINEAIDAGVDVKQLAEYGAVLFMKQVIELGFFHADLHPANIMITRDGRIAYLDFGMVGYISEEGKKAIARMLLGILRKDSDMIVENAELLGARIPRSRIPAMRAELRQIIDRYYGRVLGEMSIDIIGKEFVSLLRRYGVTIPRDYAMLSKALITIEGVGKTLYPDINVLEVAKPYVEEFIRREFPPRDVFAETVAEAQELAFFVLKIPRLTERVVAVLEELQEERRREADANETLARSVRDAMMLIAAVLLVASIAVSFALLLGFLTQVSLLRAVASVVAYLGVIVLASYAIFVRFFK